MKGNCDFDCEGPDCNCNPFSMRKADQHKATFFYISCVLLLIVASIFIVLASIIPDKVWGLILIIVSIVNFTLFFLIISNLPKSYDTTCTEYKVYYRDIGLPRMKRKYVFFIDVLIAAIPLMLFVWDIAHTIHAISNGVGSDDPVRFMYVWYMWNWTLRAQGWVDFILFFAGMFLFFIEVFIWFVKRKGDLCSAYFDDIPILGLDELGRRVQSIEDDDWNGVFGRQKKKWDDTIEQVKDGYRFKNDKKK